MGIPRKQGKHHLNDTGKMPSVASLMTMAVSAVSAFTTPALQAGTMTAMRASQPPLMIFGTKNAEQLPPGWKKVKSSSRPGEFSYENTKTGQRYNQIPPSLMKSFQRGGEFFDDERDTTAKPLEQLFGRGGGGNSESIFDKARGFYADKSSDSDLEAYFKRGRKTKDSYVEDSGFAANGEDLATVGGIYYLATVPFILFFILYVFGNIDSPYGAGGNFR